MREPISGILLMCFGFGLLRAGWSGDYQAWVNMHQVTVFCVAGVVIILGVLTFRRSCTTCSADGGCCGGHGERRITPWALVLIVAVIAGLTPAALNPGSVRVANAAVATTSGAPASWPELPGGTPELSLREVVARSATPADGRIQGHRVRIVGQLHSSGEAMMLSRVSVTCCAADARSYSVELHDSLSKLRAVEDGQWVIATVTLLPGSGTRDRDWVPRVAIAEIEKRTDAGYDTSNLI